MKRAALLTLALLALTPFTALLRAADPLADPGKIDAVIVYRGQALVTRLLTLPGPAGLHEVVVTDLPDRVIPGSLFAESAQNVEIRSILYREHPVPNDVRAGVDQLDQQIRTLTDSLTAAQKQAQLLQEQRDYLAKLEQFSAPTANVELTKGVLNAETVKNLTAFDFDQRARIIQDELKNAQSQRDLTEQLTLVQRQRDQLTASSSRTAREAVVFVNLTAPAGQLRVRYMVDQASWDSSYNVRATPAHDVTVEYNASVQQQSGEDWNDVAMTLSTATPSLVANAPILTPLAVALTSAQPQQAEVYYEEVQKSYTIRRKQAEMLRNTTNNGNFEAAAAQPYAANGPVAATQPALDDGLNKVAADFQFAELSAKDTAKPADTTRHPQPDEAISVTYQLAARSSLPSRADRQLIQVASLPLHGQFFKIAVPVLTNYVYDQATLTNDSKLVLLAGPVASYLADQFVGTQSIPTVTAGQTFTVGFGIDSSLRAYRQRVAKTETTDAGNRVLGYSYQLTIENFAATPATLRLMDRLPSAPNTARESDIKVTLDQPGQDLSKDPDYLRTDAKLGLLRWDIQVPAKATNDTTFTLAYHFNIEYDKNLALTGLPTTAR